MYPGYPDIIECQDPTTNRSNYYFLKYIDATQSHIVYHRPGKWTTNFTLTYNFDGSFNQQQGDQSHKCQNWTLDQIYNDARAYNIVTSKTLIGANTDTLKPGRPDAIMCVNQTTNNGYVFYHDVSSSLVSEYRYLKPSSDAAIKLNFNNDGSFASLELVNEDVENTSCKNLSLETLYKTGHAFNFKTSDTDNTSLSLDSQFPDLLNCADTASATTTTSS
jgi:hypothetical protein